MFNFINILNVIDNKQSGSQTPINTQTTTYELNPSMKLILIISLIVIAVTILLFLYFKAIKNNKKDNNDEQNTNKEDLKDD